jgi:hypothetical protein
MPRGDVEEERRRRHAAQLDGTLERWNGLRDIAAAQGHDPDASIAIDEAGGVIDLASDPDGLLAARRCLAELTQLGETPGEPPEDR